MTSANCKKQPRHPHTDYSDKVLLMPQILGYARVSTEDQVLDVQLTALQKVGCNIIYQETVSAVSAKRPEFHALMKHVETGDTIVVHSFSRLSRDLLQLRTIVKDMKTLGVTLKSIAEPHIDPYTTNGLMMLSMLGAVDENERGRVIERTRAAMQEKKRQGMYIGAPIKVTPAIAKQMKALRKTTSVAAIAKKFKVSPSAVYQHT